MEKKVYVEPTVSVCRMEACEMMAASERLNRYETPADASLEVLSNKDNAWDLW